MELTNTLLDRIFDKSLDCIVITDSLGNIIRINQSFQTLFGYSETEAREMHTTQLSPSKAGDYETIAGETVTIGEAFFEDSKRMLEAFMQAGSVSSWERYLLCKDGRLIIAEINLFLIHDEAGEIAASAGIFRDMTEKKKAEIEVRKSKEFLENIFRASADGIIITGRRGVITMVNTAGERMLGYSRKELVGKIINELDPPGDLHEKAGLDFIARLYEQGAVTSFPRTWQRKDGSLVDIEISAALLKDASANHTGAVAVLRDVTDHKQAEVDRRKLVEQVQRAEKMETIGTLAGGVAHDLNNVLGSIVGYPDLLLDDIPEDSPLRSGLIAIKDSGERAAAIVQDLLTLTRRGVRVTETVSLNLIVNDFFNGRELAKIKEFHPEVLIEKTLAGDLKNTTGSPVHLTKAIANLTSNAAESMPNGGRITLSTKNVILHTAAMGYDQIPAGEYAVITISDEGTGIAKEDQQRIFEPFYTKKSMGRSGTGLGMAVVWGTLKDHDGHIDIISAAGRGTEFRLYFPATEEVIAPEEDQSTLAELRGSGEKILVVDDVEAQRLLTQTILRKLNYQVETVVSGEAAVAYLKKSSADLLILDMIMDPGMDGLDTYREILKLHPGQKALIASGFSETDRVREALRLGAGTYIKKPYSLEKIGAAVKAELQP